MSKGETRMTDVLSLGDSEVPVKEVSNSIGSALALRPVIRKALRDIEIKMYSLPRAGAFGLQMKLLRIYDKLQANSRQQDRLVVDLIEALNR